MQQASIDKHSAGVLLYAVLLPARKIKETIEI